MIEELKMIDDWWAAMDTYNIDDISIMNKGSEDHSSINEAADICSCDRCV